MGGAANIWEWVVPPIAIAHETLNWASGTVGGPDLSVPGSRNAKRSGTQAPTSATRPGISNAERQRQARVAASKRKKEFQDMGRSSTILTGPMGLGGSGSGEQKTLLGY